MSKRTRHFKYGKKSPYNNRAEILHYQEGGVCVLHENQGIAQPHQVTSAVLHHPIAEFLTKAKHIFLSSILASLRSLKDPMITDISELLLEQEFTKNQHILPEVNQLLVLERYSRSISSITPKILACQCRKAHHDKRVKHWNDKLSMLTIQCAITELESQTISETHPEWIVYLPILILY